MTFLLHLPHHRRARTLTDHLLRGLVNAFALGIATEMVILAAGVATQQADPESGNAAWSRSSQTPAAVTRLMHRYDCSTTGYGHDVIPLSSVVETPAGHYRVVSFDRGWAMQTGDAPGTLIAVCLDPLRD
jgi:hypothetical protein